MNNLFVIKQQLGRIFDDNLNTIQWKNYVDYTIMGCILLSTLEIFLSTYDGIVEKYGIWLSIVDWATTIFFTVEVSLRIWCADIIDERYKGFKGRLRYCFSFYGLIDILSTYPFYIQFMLPVNYTALKSLRIMRIMRLMRVLRIFRYTKSLTILGRAMKSAKDQMVVSLQFLTIVTLLLSFILFFVEHDAQPEVYDNGMKSVLWAFLQYIGDPGGFADTPPITVAGRIIASIIGLLGIAIFAVPAGLIGSAFSEVMDEDKHEKELKDYEQRIIHSFKFMKDVQHSKLFVVPRFVPLTTITTRKFMTEADIIETVFQSECLHLYNLAQAVNKQENPQDKIVIVNYKKNTPYGCCIDRGSKVTIVATSGYLEPITNWYAYHIAKLGGFNYVAKEVEPDPDNAVTYYNINNVDDCPNMRLFLDDINRLSNKPDSWVFPILASIGLKDRPSDFHFCYATKKKDATYSDPLCTIKDTEVFEKLYQGTETVMSEKYGLHCDKNEWYVANGKTNIARYLDCKNSCTIRVECRTCYFNEACLETALDIAKVMKQTLEPEIEFTIPTDMLQRRKGHDFGMDDYID